MQHLDFVSEMAAHFRIERGKRLIEEKKSGRCGESTGERDALLLAAGKLRWIFCALIGKTDKTKQFGGHVP